MRAILTFLIGWWTIWCLNQGTGWVPQTQHHEITFVGKWVAAMICFVAAITIITSFWRQTAPKKDEKSEKKSTLVLILAHGLAAFVGLPVVGFLGLLLMQQLPNWLEYALAFLPLLLIAGLVALVLIYQHNNPERELSFWESAQELGIFAWRVIQGKET